MMASPQKSRKTPEELRQDRQQFVDRIMKADQKKPHHVLLLTGMETSNEVEERAKIMLQKLDPTRCSDINDAPEAAKSE